MMPAGWPAGVGRIVHAELGSTNAEAIRLAPKLSQPTWIQTLKQTEGRGRRGRAWVMPAGNFAATLLLKPQETAVTVALRSFVAALALADALAEAAGQVGAVTLKWPNDVLLNGGKVAGILLESSGTGGSVSHLAIGIGVNLSAAPAPDEVEQRAVPPVSLRGECGIEIAPEAFLTLLALAFAHWESVFTSDGFEPIRAAWLARAAKQGERIVARTGTQELDGLFETVDGEGSLILQTASGRRAIAAAEVFF